MKNIKRFVFTFLTVAACFSSCSEDDFLDVQNENELSSGNFYSKVENFDLALNSVYSAVKSLDLYGQTFYVETLLALPHESDYWNAQARNEVTVGDGNVLVAWRGWYRVIARANDVLENAPKFIEANNPNAATRERLDQIVGQAQFLRAFAYFHLVRLWGESTYDRNKTVLAVPLILKVATTREELMQPRATVEQIYNQILADFKAAEAALPPSWDANNIARVNKFAAKGFLGQVYLYMGEDALARPYFEEIINNSNYALVPFERYNDLFQGKNEFSSESLWELNYTVDMQQNIWENGLGSGIALSLAPPGRGWSNVTPHAVNIERFGTDPRLRIATYDPADLVATDDGSMKPAGVSEFNMTGHSFRKYVPQDYSVNTTNRNSGTNIIIMRLADVYLMYAEVMNNLGNDAVALEYVNKVRRRAYNLNPNTPQPSVDLQNLTGTALQGIIREERFKELFAEGHRWYDIVRWGIVEEEVLKYNVRYKTQTGPVIFQARDYYYPIPLQELNSNPNMVRSTGY
ncbi:RagB/SusD family nutrient uptake outer membrane protein [Sabulibacter ruber]|uniref:RagB/SusD family nutrient uptake outer membrane protein n=1 Tax=Sabulibacter ruber TaxID=2811901 RepID=UPI001A97C45D|nr:RagB/SusD family nutrient uptake outer membrane protein [Sabulibacter ruber]